MERRMLWEKQIADEKNHKFTLQYFLLVHPVPKGEMCTVLPLIRSVVDKCWNGKKFLDCLTDRRKWKSFYRNYVREMRSLWNWQNWGMTIFPQKNLSAKKIIAIHYKHKSTSFHGL